MDKTSSKEIVIRAPLPEDSSDSLLEALRNGTFALGKLSVGYFSIEIDGTAKLDENNVELAPIYSDPIGLGIEPRM